MGFFPHRTKKRSIRATVTSDYKSIDDDFSFSGLEVAVRETNVDSKRKEDTNHDTVPDQRKNRRRATKLAWWKDMTKTKNRNNNNNKDKRQPCLSSSSSSDDSSVYTRSIPMMDDGHLEDLILNLETAIVVGAKEPLRALKTLLVMAFDCKTRTKLVFCQNGRLVHAVLRFLNRCMVHSKEHNLALHLLIKLSIPQETKRMIAIECRGAWILSKLLCEDPSCHLVALVLVNLTFDASPWNEGHKAIEVTNSTIDVFNDDTGSNCCGGSEHQRRRRDNGSLLRKELLAVNGETSLVESLAFALRVSSLTKDEYSARKETIDDCNFYSYNDFSPATRLSILMAKDQQLRSVEEERIERIRRQEEEQQQRRREQLPLQPEQILQQLKANEREWKRWGTIREDCWKEDRKPWPRSFHKSHGSSKMMDEALHIYPQTARWCLAALKNLTKPSNEDATAAHVLIKTGIYSLIVQYITTEVAEESPPKANDNTYCQIDDNFLSASYGGVVVKTNVHSNETTAFGEEKSPSLLCRQGNAPYLWESNSSQDSTLSIILNLSASSESREYMNEPFTVKVLSMIAEFPRLVGSTLSKEESTTNTHDVLNFQSLKARIALSYLIGSQGHFGQTKLRSTASTIQANRGDSPLILSKSNIGLLVELLANTLNHRVKEWLGFGYLHGTFSTRSVVFSLRCLLTHTSNQERIAQCVGMELNSLLIKSLAQFALEPSTSDLDSESAGRVVFCMYLLSNHGMEDVPYLPEFYAPKTNDPGLAAKILGSYLKLSDCHPAGKHAAEQILLRIKYLNFGKHHDLARHKMMIPNVVPPTDLKINYILLAKIKRVHIENQKDGAKPDPSIFHRPVLRCRKPRYWDKISSRSDIQWNNPSTISTFASALIAVQQISFGSVKASEAIDDIAFANTIVRNANNDNSGCYGFWWAWEDTKMSKIEEYKHAENYGESFGVSSFSSSYRRQRPLRLPSIGEGEGLSLPHRNRSRSIGLTRTCSTSMDSSIHSCSTDEDEDEDDLSLIRLC